VRRSAHASFRPTAQQELLLRTALSPPAEALGAWSELSRVFDVTRIELGSYAVMPMLYRRLIDLGIEDRRLERLKGIYRKAWYRNRLVIDRARTALEGLRDERIDAVLVGGAALIARWYPEPALRHLPFLEVLVRPQDAAAAPAALAARGWSPDVRPAAISSVEPLPFRHREEHLLVLHRRLPADLRIPGNAADGEDDFWSTITPATLGEASVLTFGPSEELFGTLVLGAKTHAVPSIQWVVDAATVIGAAEIDWLRLAELAARRRLSLRTRDALAYLSDVLGVAAGEAVVDGVERVSVTRRETLAHRLATRRRGRLGGLPTTLAAHVRETADDGPISALARLPAFLAAEWGLERPSEVLKVAFRKVVAALISGTTPKTSEPVSRRVWRSTSN
jgi:Uncharacterised nucleotidyltransferase